ncbi:hypothetical protein B7463_g5116, partial [Scytalidium lignicola]
MTSQGSELLILLSANDEDDISIFNDIGSELMVIHVGPNQKDIMVHKNLICATGKFFQDMANNPNGNIGICSLPNITPEAFKLFLCYIYQRRVPSVNLAADPVAQGTRLRELCQLYSFIEEYGLNVSLLNKTIDSIQDGFRLLDKIPEAPLIQAIYKNTKAGSKLRKFCAATTLSAHRSHVFKQESLSKLVKINEDFMEDFLEAVQGIFWPDADPRIRDCAGDPDCVECHGTCLEGTIRQRRGFWPCYFHVQPLEVVKVKREHDGGEKDLDVITLGNKSNCHLWKN